MNPPKNLLSMGVQTTEDLLKKMINFSVCMSCIFQLQENCVLNLLVTASESADSGLLSDEEIISNCIHFLFAAYDTTSLTLTCTSHLLATNTHVQDKLCALLDDYWSQNKVRLWPVPRMHTYLCTQYCDSLYSTF